ncbi:globin domain-containing protein [Kitasatospora sp. NPDC049258]|uniref:globin domain-containing protein n=1 Tax=Kitasatospora sp. NPDC049258 TaxID=3155394 RepID=UPI003441792D
MLSPESTATVRATLPAVGAAISEITTLFYARMFADHPELERDLFNRGNQASGAQQQALAGAIAAYASLLVEQAQQHERGERGAAGPLLARIAHKHASLGITREQYQVVHTYLFAAIVEVLGEAVTPQVAAAWDEVYWLMAGELIALEARLYRTAGVEEGQVWQEMTVLARQQEARDAVSFTLRPADGGPAPAFRPGQYVSVAVRLPDGARQIRQYSLSTAPGESWRITVKRVHGQDGPAGEASGHLHRHLRAGDRLSVSHPFGDLVLEDGTGPLLLASAGIGCTPITGMLDHLVRTGSTRRVVAVHADRSPADHAHAGQLAELAAALPGAELHRWYEQDADGAGARPGLADLALVELPPGVTAYLCGPLPFMRAARADLLRRGVPAAAIRYEVFGPDLWLASV